MIIQTISYIITCDKCGRLFHYKTPQGIDRTEFSSSDTASAAFGMQHDWVAGLDKYGGVTHTCIGCMMMKDNKD